MIHFEILTLFQPPPPWRKSWFKCLYLCVKLLKYLSIEMIIDLSYYWSHDGFYRWENSQVSFSLILWGSTWPTIRLPNKSQIFTSISRTLKVSSGLGRMFETHWRKSLKFLIFIEGKLCCATNGGLSSVGAYWRKPSAFYFGDFIQRVTNVAHSLGGLE